MTTLGVAFQPQALSAKLTPSFASSPGKCLFMVHVYPNERNQNLIVSLIEDGEGEIRRSEVMLQGAKANPFFTFEWKDLAVGTYDAVALIEQRGGTTASVVGGTIIVVD